MPYRRVTALALLLGVASTGLSQEFLQGEGVGSRDLDTQEKEVEELTKSVSRCVDLQERLIQESRAQWQALSVAVLSSTAPPAESVSTSDSAGREEKARCRKDFSMRGVIAQPDWLARLEVERAKPAAVMHVACRAAAAKDIGLCSELETGPSSVGPSYEGRSSGDVCRSAAASALLARSVLEKAHDAPQRCRGLLGAWLGAPPSPRVDRACAEILAGRAAPAATCRSLFHMARVNANSRRQQHCLALLDAVHGRVPACPPLGNFPTLEATVESQVCAQLASFAAARGSQKSGCGAGWLCAALMREDEGVCSSLAKPIENQKCAEAGEAARIIVQARALLRQAERVRKATRRAEDRLSEREVRKSSFLLSQHERVYKLHLMCSKIMGDLDASIGRLLAVVHSLDPALKGRGARVARVAALSRGFREQSQRMSALKLDLK